MTLVPFDIPPGVVKTDSKMAATGRWVDTEKVRFVRRKAEKLGGVSKFIETQFTGTARGARAWNAYSGTSLLSFGTACDLYLVSNGTLSNITPYRTDATSLSLTDPFDTTNMSATVTVNDAGHGIEDTGITVTFSGASAVGGITIDGDYVVQSIPDGDSFTITHTSAATSTASGGGSVTASYELNCGDVDPTYLRGWGIGGWGESTWGTDRSLSVSSISEPTTWSLDIYGEDLIANRNGETIFLYDSSAGSGRATAISNAPASVRYAFVTPERYIFALGCTKGAGGVDNMTVRWPDVDDNTDWTPASTNTSEERKLQGGTRLVAGTGLVDGVSLVWSDSDLFQFQYTGSNEVYSSRSIATNCGLVGPQAWAKSSGMAFWMGQGNFWMYAGTVQPIPNVADIRDWVFSNLNTSEQFKSISFYNPLYNEVWFLFPTGASTEPDTYVMVDLDDFSWANGTWDRSAAASFSTGENRPIMLGTDGYVYVHDVVENPNDDGSAMQAYVELGLTQIEGGNRLVDIYNFVPDFETHSGDISLYLYGRDHPMDSAIMEDTVTISEGDRLVDTRSAGRQFGLKLTSNAVGGDFRLGVFSIDISRAGKRL